MAVCLWASSDWDSVEADVQSDLFILRKPPIYHGFHIISYSFFSYLFMSSVHIQDNLER